jgi:hypothetical protein
MTRHINLTGTPYSLMCHPRGHRVYRRLPESYFFSDLSSWTKGRQTAEWNLSLLPAGDWGKWGVILLRAQREATGPQRHLAAAARIAGNAITSLMGCSRHISALRFWETASGIFLLE